MRELSLTPVSPISYLRSTSFTYTIPTVILELGYTAANAVSRLYFLSFIYCPLMPSIATDDHPRLRGRHALRHCLGPRL